MKSEDLSEGILPKLKNPQPEGGGLIAWGRREDQVERNFGLSQVSVGNIYVNCITKKFTNT